LAVPRIGAEVPLALREAMLVTEAAARQARSLVALLDGVLAALTDLDLEADGTAANAVVSWPTIPALSPREREVLALVAEGRSNKAIADALFVSPNTIKTHVASLLTKLHAETRAHLAAIAASGARSRPC
jgi:DNA-binding CsgD family transcriptional regulator